MKVKAVKRVLIENMILLLTDLNAVIQHGMNMALIVPRLKEVIIGIAQAVVAQVTLVVTLVVANVV